jgi:urease accessory protein
MEIPRIWLERGEINAIDHRLLTSPLGLAGYRCIATLIFASGSPLATGRADTALEAARTYLDNTPLKQTAGVTLAAPQVMVLRVLAPMVEPAMIWAIWRESLWQLPGQPSRLWNL